jgi:lactoylglutathione lyase
MIKSIGHAAFGVTDIEKSLDFYCGILGFQELFRMNNKQTGKLSGVYIKVAHEQYLEMFQASSVNNSSEQSYKHLCLHVEDIDGVIKSIKDKDYPIDREVLTGGDGNLQAWIRDPDGNRIEFMELMPDSLQKKNDP